MSETSKTSTAVSSEQDLRVSYEARLRLAQLEINEQLSVYKTFAMWLGVKYSRVCPKCGGVIIVTGAWQVVTKLTPSDHDYAYGFCRKTKACGWRGEMKRIDDDKKIAK